MSIPFSQLGILVQYENSHGIVALANGLADALDLGGSVQEFHEKVMDISNAQGVYLDWWGALVNVSRNFAYTLDGTNYLTVTLGDEEYRVAIRLKAFSSVSRATLETLNRSIVLAMGADTAFWMRTPVNPADPTLGVKPMSLTLVVREESTLSENSTLYRVLLAYSPLPVSVEISTPLTVSDTMFGFYGSQLNPFDQGIFHN